MDARVQFLPAVEAALLDNRPVVALETAVVTHGLPRTALVAPPGLEGCGWNETSPVNLETARLLQRTVREAGATPATIAVIDGTLRIGLEDEQLVQLAGDTSAIKASARDLPFAMATGRNAGTTVAATLAACRFHREGFNPIRVFATGGIGGVHRDSGAPALRAGGDRINFRSPRTGRADISADLLQLATTPVCVVSAGAKSILDLPATLERLDTLGVVVIGYRTDYFPRFYSPGTEKLPVPARLENPQQIGRLCRIQWQTLQSEKAVLIVNPIPDQYALPAEMAEKSVERAIRQAEKQGVRGSAVTPFLLDFIAGESQGRSLTANIALLVNNAGLASAIALEVASGTAGIDPI